MAEQVLLCITSGSHESAEKKGVSWMFGGRDEGGYFSKVLNLHYNVRRCRVVRLSPTNVIYEAGLPFRLAGPFLCLFLGMYLCLRYGVTVVRATDPYISGFLGWMIARVCRVPFCVSVHSDFDLSYKLTGRSPMVWKMVGEWMVRLVLSQARLVLVIREHLRGYVTRHGARRDRIRVIPHGMDMTSFHATAGRFSKVTFGVPGKHVVLFVGRLSKENYVEDVIRIASKVDEAVVMMVGDGDERARLEGMSEDYGLSGRIEFVGFQNRDKVVEAELMADVGLCLRGGFTLIEMAAAGLPLVSYDVDWHYELVQNGLTGFLLPEGDVEGVADAIRRLLDDRGLAEWMGRNAKALALERHSLEETARIKVECYREVVR